MQAARWAAEPVEADAVVPKKDQPKKRRDYLAPYLKACRLNRGGVRSLLWEDRRAQEVRFEAIARSCPMDGLHVLDVGCGHGDLLTYLRAHGVFPARYTGVEAAGPSRRFARLRRQENVRIIAEDFVRAPGVLDVGADAVVFSGSLNLLRSPEFYRIVRLAWAATGQYLAFNFLDSHVLTGARWLRWHRRETVVRFAEGLARSVIVDHSYEDGDCTIVMRR